MPTKGMSWPLDRLSPLMHGFGVGIEAFVFACLCCTFSCSENGASSALRTDTTHRCEQGDTRECVGAGACRGGQSCDTAGQWSRCECGNNAPSQADASDYNTEPQTEPDGEWDSGQAGGADTELEASVDDGLVSPSPQAECAYGYWDDDQSASTSCVPWTVCVAGEYVSSPGSHLADQACGACPEGQFTSQPDQTLCEDWTTCSSGYKVAAEGTAVTDRECSLCVNGTFSSTTNSSMCSPWTICPEDQPQSTPGDASHDVECGRTGWLRQFGGAEMDYANSIVVDDLGSVYVSGLMDLSLGAGSMPTGFYARLDGATGQESWFQTIGEDTIHAALGDAATLVIAYDGSFQQSPTGFTDVVVHGVSRVTGQVQWSKVITSSSSDYVGVLSSGEDGTVYVGGRFYGVEQTDPENYLNAFLLSLDAQGTRQETFLFQSDGSLGEGELTTGIARLSDGSFVASANAYGVYAGEVGFGDPDSAVLKLSSTGAIEWVTQFGTTASDETTALLVDAAGSSYVTVYSKASYGEDGNRLDVLIRDAYLYKLDNTGAILWERSLTSELEEGFQAAAFDADGNVVVCGTSGQQVGAEAFGGNDAIVIAYSPDGEVLWVDQFGTESTDTCEGIAIVGEDIYLTGTTGGNFPGQDKTGSWDVYVKKYRH